MRCLMCAALESEDDMSRCTCRFQDRSARVQARSPHGRRKGWALRPVIVKSGDDCRQESLAMQLITAFDTIFQV